MEKDMLDFDYVRMQRCNRIVVPKYDNRKLKWVSPWSKTLCGLNFENFSLDKTSMFFTAWYEEDKQRKILGIDDGGLTFLKTKDLKNSEPTTLLGYLEGIGDYQFSIPPFAVDSHLEREGFPKEMKVILELLKQARIEFEKAGTSVNQIRDEQLLQQSEERKKAESNHNEQLVKRRRLIMQYANTSE